MPYAAESILVTIAREAKKVWPMWCGMAVVGAAVVKVTAAATPEVRARGSRRLRRARWRARPAVCAASCSRWAWGAVVARRAVLGFAERLRSPPAARALRRCAPACPLCRALQDIRKSKFTNPGQAH